MKRDMDVARNILMKIEEAPFDGGPIDIIIEGIENSVLQYHILILTEAGLINSIDATTLVSGPEYVPLRLTWFGHEFLEASRSEGIWSKAKTKMLEKVGGLPFDVLLYVLKEYAKQSILE